MTEKRRSKTGWIIGGVVVVAVILLSILLWPKGSYVSDGGRVTKVIALDCKATYLEDAFFKSEVAQRSTHEIRAIFKDNKFADISYIFEATYNSSEAVESENARLHADYNIYMSENGQSQELLEPSFANIKSKLKITLYGNKKRLNSVTAKLFFLDIEGAQNIDKYSVDELEKVYKKKSFSCSRSE